MPGTIIKSGPTALTNTYTTNVFNDTNTNVFNIVRHIHVANKTASAVTFRLYLGLTGANTAGTEIFYDKSVAAYDCFDYYTAMRMASTDFLVGGASAATSLVITIAGERIPV